MCLVFKKLGLDIYNMNVIVYVFKVFGCLYVCVYSFKEVVKGN